jgi:hypothetical protein
MSTHLSPADLRAARISAFEGTADGTADGRAAGRAAAEEETASDGQGSDVSDLDMSFDLCSLGPDDDAPALVPPSASVSDTGALLSAPSQARHGSRVFCYSGLGRSFL